MKINYKIIGNKIKDWRDLRVGDTIKVLSKPTHYSSKGGEIPPGFCGYTGKDKYPVIGVIIEINLEEENESCTINGYGFYMPDLIFVSLKLNS